jgi:hypothetical protein
LRSRRRGFTTNWKVPLKATNTLPEKDFEKQNNVSEYNAAIDEIVNEKIINTIDEIVLTLEINVGWSDPEGHSGRSAIPNKHFVR